MADSHMDAHTRAAIKTHTETCLMYARRNTFTTYATPLDLALDYGINGTRDFFPLSQLVHDIYADERFTPHIRSLKYARKQSNDI